MANYTKLTHEQSLQLVWDFMLNGSIKPNKQTVETISMLSNLKGTDLCKLLAEATFDAKNGLNDDCAKYGMKLQQIALNLTGA